ncbi:unnamed protein product [Linum tenue]|uniref:Uncharacterized protein n=1 Tax=Linum tenue TaxID=586396 RepID=A0AAV0LEM2_9ROSI|nr:unnamed protein product [Linum tenue]
MTQVNFIIRSLFLRINFLLMDDFSLWRNFRCCVTSRTFNRGMQMIWLTRITRGTTCLGLVHIFTSSHKLLRNLNVNTHACKCYVTSGTFNRGKQMLWLNRITRGTICLGLVLSFTSSHKLLSNLNVNTRACSYLSTSLAHIPGWCSTWLNLIPECSTATFLTRTNVLPHLE